MGDGATLPGRVEVELAAEAPSGSPCGPATSATVEVVGPTGAGTSVPVAGPPVDVVNNVGSVLIEGGYGADRGFLEPDPASTTPRPTCSPGAAAASCCARPTWPTSGLFDERFFLYYEDTDLSWRGRSRGWRYRYVPGPVARHVHAALDRRGLAHLPALRGAQPAADAGQERPPGMAAHAVWRYP